MRKRRGGRTFKEGVVGGGIYSYGMEGKKIETDT